MGLKHLAQVSRDDIVAIFKRWAEDAKEETQDVVKLAEERADEFLKHAEDHFKAVVTDSTTKI
jgi:vacuolar-type H+-ATPase subunit H